MTTTASRHVPAIEPPCRRSLNMKRVIRVQGEIIAKDNQSPPWYCLMTEDGKVWVSEEEIDELADD